MTTPFSPRSARDNAERCHGLRDREDLRTAWTRRLCISAALSLLAAPASLAADIVVYHNWSSPRELAALTVDGYIPKVPATIHADATIYYNRAVAKAAGIDPETWTSLDGVWADAEAAERSLADVMVDPQVHADFAVAQGSTPVRLDVRNGIDQCSRQVVAALDRPGSSVLPPHLAATPERVTATWAVANAYWNNPGMSGENGVGALRQSLLGLP